MSFAKKYIKIFGASFILGILGFAIAFSQFISGSDFPAFAFKASGSYDYSSREESSDPVSEIRLSKSILKDLILSKFKNGEGPIKVIHDFNFSAIDGTIQVRGQIDLSEMVVKLASQQVSGIVEFELIFRPTVTGILSADSSNPPGAESTDDLALNIQVVSLKINQQETSQLFPTVAKFAAAALRDPSLIKTILADPNRIQGNALTTFPLKVEEFLESNGIQFNSVTKSVSFRLNLAEFMSLSPALQKELGRYKLWYFGPIKATGSSEGLFYMAIGRGSPAKQWVQGLHDKLTSDSSFLMSGNSKDYETYSNATTIASEFENHWNSVFDIRKPNLKPTDSTRIQEYKKDRLDRTLKILNKLDSNFLRDPKQCYLELFQYLDSEMLGFMNELSDRNDITEKLNKSVGTQRALRSAPMLDQFVSQRTLDHIVGFVRDIETSSEKVFTDLSVKINPEFQGLTISGKFNTKQLKDFPVPPYLSGPLLEMGPVPFSLKSQVFLEPQGWLRVNVIEASLFSGANKMTIHSYDKNGDLILRIANNLARQSIVSMLLKKDSKTQAPTDAVEVNKQIKKRLEDLAQNYWTLAKSYSSGAPIKSDNLLLQLISSDLQGNPTVADARKETEDRLNMSITEAIQEDVPNKTLRIALNPQIIRYLTTDKVGELYFWNYEPFHHKTLDRNYLNFAIGYGPRSKEYHQQITSNPDRATSVQKHFEFLKARNAVDMTVGIQFDDLSDTINRFLEEFKIQLNQEIEQKLANEETGEYWSMSDIRLGVNNSGYVETFIALNYIKKSKRWFFDPARWFGDDHSTKKLGIAFRSETTMKVVDLDDFADKIQVKEKDVFLGMSAIELDVARATIEVGKASDAENLFKQGKVTLAVSTDLSKKTLISYMLKAWILKFVTGFFENPQDEGNSKFKSMPINSYVRLYNTKDNILMALNPRFLFPSIDSSILVSENINGTDTGLKVRTQQKMLYMDFATASVISISDRQIIQKVVLGCADYDSTLMKVQTKEQFEKFIKDKHPEPYFFLGSTENRSLLGQMARIWAYVPELYKIEKPSRETRRFSESGVEIAYTLAATVALYQSLDRLENAANRFAVKISTIRSKNTISDEKMKLKARIDKYMAVYKEGFNKKNKALIRIKHTDWGRPFAADALFSEAVYTYAIGAMK